MFYTYDQNNSGGSWREPAFHVIIEASAPWEADHIAELNGLYFNGCDQGIDCECCGDRWYSASDNNAQDVPSIYGDPVEDHIKDTRYHSGNEEIPEVIVYYKDGNVQVLNP